MSKRGKMNNLYENLSKINIIRQCMPMMEPNGGLYIDTETLKITARRRIPLDTNWVMVKEPIGIDCVLNYSILFGLFARVLGMPPSRCQYCWKVSVKPETLEQLFKLEKVQRGIKDQVYGCKFGIDTREYVLAKYGGYFYCRGKEEGLKTLELVRKEVKEHIGDIPVLLKRACTEMEKEFGDSINWQLTDLHLEKEALIKDNFDLSSFEPIQPDMVKVELVQRFIEFAAKIGDKTYLNYVNKPLHVPCRSYEPDGNDNKEEGI